jgi:tripartite-type tricarboxylate transporter receptor subunit TctC
MRRTIASLIATAVSALAAAAEGQMPTYPDRPIRIVVAFRGGWHRRQLSYGSGGLGTTSHLAGELFKVMNKIDIVHIPYKGNVPAITDLLGSQTSMAFATMPTVLPQVLAGKLRALAVLGAEITKWAKTIKDANIKVDRK